MCSLWEKSCPHTCTFYIAITKHLKLDHFIEQRGLFWLVVLEVCSEGAISSDSLLGQGGTVPLLARVLYMCVPVCLSVLISVLLIKLQHSVIGLGGLTRH